MIPFLRIVIFGPAVLLYFCVLLRPGAFNSKSTGPTVPIAVSNTVSEAYSLTNFTPGVIYWIRPDEGGRVEWETSAQRVVDECNNPTAPQPAPMAPRFE